MRAVNPARAGYRATGRSPAARIGGHVVERVARPDADEDRAGGQRDLGDDRDGDGLDVLGAASVSRRSMRSPMGRMVDESGTPGRVLVSVGLEDHRIGPAADDDDVIGAGRGAQLLDDRPDDGVGRHGPRQTGQDPREGLGLAASPGLELEGRLAMADRRDSGDDEETRGWPSRAGCAPLTRTADEDDEGQEGERNGEGGPRPADPAIRRVHAALWGRVGLGHLGIEVWDSNVRSSTRLRGTGGSWAPSTFVRGRAVLGPEDQAAASPAAAASWPPSRLTR